MIRCRVATRVRGERGGTTGVFDRRVDEKRGERERETRTRGDKEAHPGKRLGNAEDTSWAEKQETRTQVYVYCSWINRLQPIRPARQMPTPDNPRTQGTRWRFCRKHTGAPRSSTSLPKTCGKKAMENDREEEFGPRPDNTSFPLTRDTLSLCLPLFYSSRRETVCHPFTSH